MAWCLTKDAANRFRQALKDGTINPDSLSSMESVQRREFLAKYVGEENAVEVNALFESKLLLKNQKAGMISWAKKVAGITEKTRRDMIARIERLTEVLDPADGDQFLNDLVNTRLKIEVTQEEAKNIADLSREITRTKAKADADGKFASEDERFEYGAAKVAMEKYINDLKLKSKKITFKENPIEKSKEVITEVPSFAKSMKASLDNSFWGRQGIKVLSTDPKIWTENFVKSWGDIAKEFKGIDAMDSIRADIYSRPNAINGKYKAGKYGLDALSEEAFPSSLPERIPAFGRLFKASESAYNGAALRLRADLADRYIALAEEQGLNMNNKAEAEGLGHVISSLTGRGSLGAVTPQTAKSLNVFFFSVKYVKGNFDVATAHIFDRKAPTQAKKLAGKNLLKILGTQASILALAKLIDPDSVDEDPRSTNFGKIKLWGHWVDITGGMWSLYTLASRLVPTVHDGEWGFWYKSQSGKWTNLTAGEYGQMDAFDVLTGFIAGKFSPFLGLFRDFWRGQDYNGNPVNIGSAVKTMTVPLPIENSFSILRDPNSSFVVGSIILDSLGFSTGTSILTNEQTNAIPVETKVENGDIISYVLTYATAVGVDPETAFNRIFTGQKIRKVTNNTIIVERIPVNESQAIKEERGGKNPEMKLDHTIPLELGGSNAESNLKLVTTSTWSSYTPVENALGKALKEGKITKATAQKLIIDFKEGKLTKEQVLAKLK